MRAMILVLAAIAAAGAADRHWQTGKWIDVSTSEHKLRVTKKTSKPKP